MPTRFLISIALVSSCLTTSCFADDLMFQDLFDQEISARWQAVGLTKDDYRVRAGGLEVRAKSVSRSESIPFLKVDLPFTTDDTVFASVDVSVLGEPLPRGAYAGLALTDADGPVFTIRKTNIDGFFVFAPGEVEFIGQPGQEGDPSNFTVKYWPAKAEAGPLRVILRGSYAHAQVGPSSTGQYKTFFHSAIKEAKEGLGFGLIAIKNQADGEHWVRFDNFRVRK